MATEGFEPSTRGTSHRRSSIGAMLPYFDDDVRVISSRSSYSFGSASSKAHSRHLPTFGMARLVQPGSPHTNDVMNSGIPMSSSSSILRSPKRHRTNVTPPVRRICFERLFMSPIRRRERHRSNGSVENRTLDWLITSSRVQTGVLVHAGPLPKRGSEREPSQAGLG